ncbi:MAG: hypothetical protein OEY23_15710 [Acidimicrobiia bacterium]|nr:hypothetical protein [Acidimicrobiia bacterium]
MESVDDEAAARLLAKIRSFAASLDDRERAGLAALLAPGVAQAWAPAPRPPAGPADGSAAFDGIDTVVSWRPSDLPDALTEAIRADQFRLAEG